MIVLYALYVLCALMFISCPWFLWSVYKDGKKDDQHTDMFKQILEMGHCELNEPQLTMAWHKINHLRAERPGVGDAEAAKAEAYIIGKLDGLAGPGQAWHNAIDILDGNKEPIDWRDETQPEILRKLCEHLEAHREAIGNADLLLDLKDIHKEWGMRIKELFDRLLSVGSIQEKLSASEFHELGDWARKVMDTITAKPS